MKLRHLVSRPLYRLYESRLAHQLDIGRLPQHIGVILDGNRRFARSTGLADHSDGHRAGMGKFVEFLSWAAESEIPAVTAWLLSTENLERDATELGAYYDILEDLFTEKLPDRARALDMSIRVIGSIDLLPVTLAAAAKQLEEANPQGRRRLTIALAYGGRQEIVDAVRDLVAELAANGMSSEEIAASVNADAIAANLYTADLPDPDLVIRTSGESRLSGFLLWQSAYAEYSFIDVFWPAFRKVDLLRALRDFTRRERRFGR